MILWTGSGTPCGILMLAWLCSLLAKREETKKIIGPDSKLKEPEDLCTVTTKDIVHDIIDGKPASDNLEDALL